MGNTLQSFMYECQYGKKNIYDLESDDDAGFYAAVHHDNSGRIQTDIDNGIAFIWNNKLIYTNR